MHKPALVCAAMAVAAAVTASAEDFPLTFRTIAAKDVMAFPGGYGASASLQLTRPTAVKKEPKAVSPHPLYGQCQLANGDTLAFRLDESKGDGKGYDLLIVDLNHNGDLTDDSAAPRVALPTDLKAASGTEQMLFGPLEAPVDKMIAGGRPVSFAHVYLYNRRQLGPQASRSVNIPLGSFLLKAAWYLDTTVELNGVKQRVGVYDGDGNMRLGDMAKAQINRSGGQDSNWYFKGGDTWLVDANGSGAFENDPFQTESCPFGSILYLGTKPYKAGLASDCKSLRVEPWTEALAEVALQPRGDQIRSLTVAWERPNGQWQLIRAGVADGKINVPPGNYRLYSCDLLGKGAPRDQVMASGSQRVPQKPFSFVAGKANTLRCGGPLEIKVTASRNTSPLALLDLFSSDDSESTSKSSPVLRINANVSGAGGEVYSTYGKAESLRSRPPRPVFTIVDADGKELANGNLEFG
jgi:hypothetical protein